MPSHGTLPKASEDLWPCTLQQDTAFPHIAQQREGEVINDHLAGRPEILMMK